jgi:transcriptional regulator with XRE-family HTH domain
MNNNIILPLISALTNETKQNKRENKMKEQIGKKIFRLRKKKNLTQENVLQNQSQVALIEKGTKKGGISNPKENTLRVIAKNMDMTFDELIEDTTWEKREKKSVSEEIAFSPAVFDIEVDDMLNITWSHKSFPLYNDKGEKNEFCIYSGRTLIDKCKKCSRGVTNVKQQFCSGCGETLFSNKSLPSKITELLSEPGILTNYYHCADVISELVRRKSWDKAILVDLRDMVTTNKESLKHKLIKSYSQAPKNSVGGFAVAAVLTNIAEILQAGKEIKLENLSLLEFFDQAYEAAIKKLRVSLKNMKKPKRPESVDEIKTELTRKIAIQIDDRIGDLRDPKTIAVTREMMGMLKDLSTTGDSDELIEKLQSKIDLNTESDENSNDEKISEDGNSETAPENETEQDSNNAQNNDNKESKDD